MTRSWRRIGGIGGGLAALVVALVAMSIRPAAAQGVTLEAQAGPTVAACRYTGWAADGCSGSTGRFLILNRVGAASFYDYAAQSGQHWAGGAHPWTWNSPGIDYGVGPDINLQLTDPATARLPKGCAYQPEGSASHGPRIYCGRESDDPVLDGLDLSLHGCTPVVADAGASGLITIQNSNLVNGPNCAGPDMAMVRILNGATGLSLRHDVVDADYPHSTAPVVLVGDGGPVPGPVVILYTAQLNGPPGPLVGNYAGPLDIENSVNLGSDIVSRDASGQRGEICELGCPSFPIMHPSIIFRNNVVLVPADTHIVLEPGSAATETPTGGGSFVADHNILVINHVAGAMVTVVTGINGRIDRNILTVKPGYVGVLSRNLVLEGLPDGEETTILAAHDDGQYTVSGLHPAAEVVGAVAKRQTTVAASLRVTYPAGYADIVMTDNFIDSTGAYSCSHDFAAAARNAVVRGNRNLVTGQGIRGVTEMIDPAICKPPK